MKRKRRLWQPLTSPSHSPDPLLYNRFYVSVDLHSVSEIVNWSVCIWLVLIGSCYICLCVYEIAFLNNVIQYNSLRWGGVLREGGQLSFLVLWRGGRVTLKIFLLFFSCFNHSKAVPLNKVFSWMNRSPLGANSRVLYLLWFWSFAKLPSYGDANKQTRVAR